MIVSTNRLRQNYSCFNKFSDKHTPHAAGSNNTNPGHLPFILVAKDLIKPKISLITPKNKLKISKNKI
jgi:hypothetical protein